MYLLAHDVCPTDPDIFFKTTKSYFNQFLKEYDTNVPENASRFAAHFPEDDIPLMLYGIGYDSTYTPILQLLVQKGGTLNESITLKLQRTILPISLQTINVMNQLIHCGDALNTMLRNWKVEDKDYADFRLVEDAVKSVLGVDKIADHEIYTSFIDDPNNSRFKAYTIPSFVKKQDPFPYFGSCFLVAFRNCAIHSGLEVAYGYFPGRDADIIQLARAIRDSGGLPALTCYLYYL